MYKYPKHYRIPHDSISVAYGKRYLDVSSLKDFLKVKDYVVLEKIDGSQMGIGWKGGLPYMQGKNSHIPQGDTRKAYSGAWSWAWANQEKFQKLENHTIFGEWMRVQHNMPYDSLPDWFIGFDVYDNRAKRFFDTMQALDFIKEVGFATIPVIYEGELAYDDLLPLLDRKKSAFSSSDAVMETKFNEEEKQNILHPKVKGVARNRFETGEIFMEGGIFKARANLKFYEDKGNTYWRNAAKLVVREFLQEFSEDSHWTSERMRENKLAGWNISNEKKLTQ